MFGKEMIANLNKGAHIAIGARGSIIDSQGVVGGCSSRHMGWKL